MKKKYFLIVGILILLLVGGYFGAQKFTHSENRIGNEKKIILENHNIETINSEINKTSGENQEITIVSLKDSITKKQEYDFQKNEIMFYEKNELISVYNLKKNNPYEGISKYNVLKSVTSINTPNKFDYEPNYIMVSYHATEKKVDDFDFLTTIKILNLNGYEVLTTELKKTRFIAKSISNDLKYLYGIQLTKDDLNDDYREYKPIILDLETKKNLLHNFQSLESFKYSEYTYGMFPKDNYLLLAVDNKRIENIKLLDLKENKIVWIEKADLNKFSIKINKELINIIDNKSLSIISTKNINQ